MAMESPEQELGDDLGAAIASIFSSYAKVIGLVLDEYRKDNDIEESLIEIIVALETYGIRNDIQQ